MKVNIIICIVFNWFCASLNAGPVEKGSNYPKLLPVIVWTDTAFLNTEDLFDEGKADRLVAIVGDLIVERVDSVNFLFYGEDLKPYQVLRAYQGNQFVDVICFRKGSRSNDFQQGISMISSSWDLEIQTDATQFLIFWNNQLILDSQLRRGIYNLRERIPLTKGRSHLRIFGYHGGGILADLLIPLEEGIPITNAESLSRNDLHGNIMYFAFLDRFFDGNPANNRKVKHPLVTQKTNYMGGDISGLEEIIKRGYFNELSINSLWISPITRNPDGAWGNFTNPHVMFSGYHGYWPILNTVIDPRMGTSEELRQTLRAAHDSGMNVLLDYVAHHVHKEHPIYLKHPDWVTPLYLPDGTLNTERWDDHRLTTWFDTFMPTLDLGRPEVASYMVDSALFWLHEFEFDGFRHDATKHIPENFTRLLTKRIRSQISTRKGKNIYQIGETYGNPELISSYIGPGLLDAQFDFNLYDRMVDVFAFNDSFGRLVYEQQRSIQTYGLHHLMGNITGNQDRVRFMSFADGTLARSKDWNELKRIGHTQDLKVKGKKGFDKFAMFYAYQMAIPGIPVIYYGDEFGMPGANDPGNRNPMRFKGLNKEELQLKNWVRSCTKFRRSSMALLYGDFEILFYDDDRLVFRRTYLDETVIGIVNKGKSDFRWNDGGKIQTYGKMQHFIGCGVPYKDFYRVSAQSAKLFRFKK
jgi:cyclomaltodextrinase